MITWSYITFVLFTEMEASNLSIYKIKISYNLNLGISFKFTRDSIFPVVLAYFFY